MNDKIPKPLPLRPAYPQKYRKSLIETLADLFRALRSLSTFFVMFGMLILGTGIICFIPFRNPISVLILDLGFVLVLFGFAMKILDILIKIVGDKA